MFNRIPEEQGFTLIELLVVILIIGILIAVAAPSFLGQQDKAKDSALKQDMTVLYKSAKAASTEYNGSYPPTTELVAALKASEPQLAPRIIPRTEVPPATPASPIGALRQSTGALILSGRSTSGNEFRLVAGDPLVPGGAPIFLDRW